MLRQLQTTNFKILLFLKIVKFSCRNISVASVHVCFCCLGLHVASELRCRDLGKMSSPILHKISLKNLTLLSKHAEEEHNLSLVDLLRCVFVMSQFQGKPTKFCLDR
jgi:hypothetical protein